MENVKSRNTFIFGVIILFLVVSSLFHFKIVFAGTEKFTPVDITGMTGAEAIVAIARAQLGKSGSDLGYTDWCAKFVSDCAAYVGQSEAIPWSAGPRELKKLIEQKGGKEESSPQKGDIVFYFWNNGQHVGIMEDSINSIHGNLNDRNGTGYKVREMEYTRFSCGKDCSYNTYIVRPKYKSTDTEKPLITEARIENITNTSYDVYLKGSDNLSQKLKFRIGTWNDYISIDDAKWQESEYLSSKEVRFTVRISEFGNAKDVIYHTNAYVIDESGNVSTAIRVGDTYIASLIGDLSCDWIETNVLPDNVTTANCEIQYNNHYQKSAASSPGSGWTKTGSGTDKYDPVGDPFEQSYELTPSATLELVDYKYYHYCGHANQWVDHWQHDDYNHKCGPYDKYLFTETETKKDDGNYGDGHTRYLYRVKWSAEGTASTGWSGYATCGGTGSDWYYKMFKYQRYQLVTYYTWVKDSGWTMTRDSSANSVTIRYRLKSGCGVRDIVLPTGLKEIQSSAFEGSTVINEVTIPSGVTTIGSRAFANCTGLTLVRIPDSVTSIGANTFLNDSGVTLNCQSDNTTCSTYARNNNISLRIGY